MGAIVGYANKSQYMRKYYSQLFFVWLFVCLFINMNHKRVFLARQIRPMIIASFYLHEADKNGKLTAVLKIYFTIRFISSSFTNLLIILIFVKYLWYCLVCLEKIYSTSCVWIIHEIFKFRKYKWIFFSSSFLSCCCSI